MSDSVLGDGCMLQDLVRFFECVTPDGSRNRRNSQGGCSSNCDCLPSDSVSKNSVVNTSCLLTGKDC
jgi:hypothetical protein